MSALPLLDLRERPVESLPTELEARWKEGRGDALLVASRRPSKRWTAPLDFARPLHLASAPLYELVLWVDAELDLSLPADVVEEQREMLAGYRGLFEQPSGWEAYDARLRRHIRDQEAELYPRLLERAPVERATRELSYEHRGLEKGCQRLGEMLRAGGLEKKDRDRLDLDFFHLLEHHVERERDALIPAWIFLTKHADKG